MAGKKTYEDLERRVAELEAEHSRSMETIAALEESERKYRDLFENAPVGIFRTTSHGKPLGSNTTLARFLDFDSPEDALRHFSRLDQQLYVRSERREQFIQLIQEKGFVENFEYEARTATGRIIWLSMNAKIIERNEDGSFIIEGFSTDITERKSTEQALKESEVHLRTLVNTVPDLVWLKDPDGVFLACNRRFERLLNAKEKDIIGKTDYDFVDKELADFFRENDNRAIAAGNPVRNEETVTYATDGHREILETIKTPMFANDGRLVGVLGVGRDITERKQMEEALRYKEFLLEEMGKIAGIGGWEFDPVTGRGTWTKEVYRIHDVKPGEAITVQDSIDFFQGESRAKIEKAVREAVQLGNPFDLELELISAKGVHKWVHSRGQAIIDHGNVMHVRGSFQDITERKLAEQRLRESEDKLVRAKKMESLGMLAGGVAHDLNNVLSGIVSYPELLLMTLPADSPIRKSIETIEQSGKKAVAIVQDLLTVARGVAVEKQAMNLNDVVDSYLESAELAKLLQFHPLVSISVDQDPDLLNVQGSPVHISKALMNLVSNAAEAIPGNGSVSVTTTNRYIDRPLKGYDDVKVGEYAVMAVRDNGPGISPGDLKRIFEPFYTKKVMGRSGTGLGLAVVWNVVQDHKGYIDVSTCDSGTVFELYFPINRDIALKEEKPLNIGDCMGNKETILVVDDEESQREISCNMLDILGYKATAVSCGEDAVDYLKENFVDLVLLDMIMEPGINGCETYRRILEIRPGQKAIIVSGFAETDDVKETLRMGAGIFIKKPFRLGKLGMAVKETLTSCKAAH